MTASVVENIQNTQPYLFTTDNLHLLKNITDCDRLNHSHPWIELIGVVGFDTKRQKFVLVQFQPQDAGVAGCHSLSERERQVLELVAQGFTNAQIGQQLTITENTVKAHLQNIFAKLNVQSRTEAAFLAAKQGWVDW